MRITRRRVLSSLAGLSAGGLGFGGYALAQTYGLDVTTYDLSPPGWPAGLRLRLAVVADLHACDPWMSLERIRGIVQTTNALKADAIVLLGDFVSGEGLNEYGAAIPHHLWAKELASLSAPFGVHAVLGNHDWWENPDIQKNMRGTPAARTALEAVGIPVYENTAVRLVKGDQPFWIAGLGDQWAYHDPRHLQKPRRADGVLPRHGGVDDLPGLMQSIGDDSPVILLVHEPDIFPEVSDRVALTLAGHTHGGQVRILGYAPIVPSQYGQRYLYGHIVEDGRHLIVSSGLGCSALPVRIGAAPEIVVVNLGGAQAAA